MSYKRSNILSMFVLTIMVFIVSCAIGKTQKKTTFLSEFLTVNGCAEIPLLNSRVGWFVETKINDIPAIFVIDTGASASVMDLNDIEKYKLDTKTNDANSFVIASGGGDDDIKSAISSFIGHDTSVMTLSSGEEAASKIKELLGNQTTSHEINDSKNQIDDAKAGQFNTSTNSYTISKDDPEMMEKLSKIMGADKATSFVTPVKIKRVVIDELVMHDYILNDLLLTLVNLDNINKPELLKEYKIKKHDGIIGYEILTENNAIIDVGNHNIYFCDEQVNNDDLATFLKKHDYQAIPLELAPHHRTHSGALLLEASIGGVSGKFLIDTGATISFLSDIDYVNAIGLDVAYEDTTFHTVYGDIKGDIGVSVINEMKLGEYTYNDLKVSVHEDTKTDLMSQLYHTGILGRDFLTKGMAIIDCGNMMLYMR